MVEGKTENIEYPASNAQRPSLTKKGGRLVNSLNYEDRRGKTDEGAKTTRLGPLYGMLYLRAGTDRPFRMFVHGTQHAANLPPKSSTI